MFLYIFINFVRFEDIMITRIVCIAVISTQVFCMDNSPVIICDIAQEKDLPGILALYEKATTNENDNEKIVILPVQIREEATRAAIANKRLFVAKINNTVVAFKKNYVVSDHNELQEILTQEFRFIENKSIVQRNVHVDKNIFSTDAFVDKTYHFTPEFTYIYTGADFTHPDYRGKGINTQLSLKSLISIMENIKPNAVSLIFGLTEPNAEFVPEKKHIDRVPGIAKVFAQALARADKNVDLVSFTHYKTRAYMPHFTYEKDKLIISSDDESTPGFGNILECNRTKENNA